MNAFVKVATFAALVLGLSGASASANMINNQPANSTFNAPMAFEKLAPTQPYYSNARPNVSREAVLSAPAKTQQIRRFNSTVSSNAAETIYHRNPTQQRLTNSFGNPIPIQDDFD
ncbi:MAG: hypothetical protein ACK5XX_01055 [Holosporales bacterium]|jgi:hypothetical protein